MERSLELVQAEVMKRFLILTLVFSVLCSCAPRMSWESFPIDGHRTGVTPVVGDKVSESLGSFDESGSYVSPNGRAFGGIVADAARIMIDVQPGMSYLKECVGYCPGGMVKAYPESGLSNWAADAIRAGVASVTGRKVDVGITNFGGIRIEMPDGEVLIDDLVAMFPFRNYLSYVSLKGSDLRVLFERFAKQGVQAVSGVVLTFSGDGLESAVVGGAPLDDNAVYGVGTNDFLLDGGDNLFLARNATEMIISDVQIKEWIVDYVRDLNSRGLEIKSEVEGRVVLK